VELTADKGTLGTAQMGFQQQRRTEGVDPSTSEIVGGHRVINISRNIKRTDVDHIEPIVAEKQVIFAADLLVNSEIVVIGIIYVRRTGDGVEHSAAREIG